MTADKRSVVLTTGEDKIIDLDFDVNAGAAGISVGNPKVLTTTLVKIGDKRQVVLKPLSAGHTTITLRDKDGTLRLIFSAVVADANLIKMTDELQKLLGDIEGISIRLQGDKAVIDGEVLVPSDYGRILNVVEGKNSPYTDKVLNLVSLSPVALSILAKKIQQDINTFAPNATTRVINGTIWLEGSVESMDQARRAEKVALLYLPELKPGNPLEKDPTVQRLPPKNLIQNLLVINPPPPKKQEKLVRVTVYFVELSKDYKKLFGFKWQPGFTADPQIAIGTTGEGGTGAEGGTTFTGTISSLFPKLQSAQDAGFARILKTGTVIVRSGQPATLNDTTEIPYATQGPNGQMATQTAKVGLSVAVTPKILGQGEDIQLDLEMSQLNLAGRAGNSPITASHRVKTKLYVKSNESAAVAGVQSADVQTNFNKDDPNPGSFGGQTSPLFTLLRSKSYAKKKSQFVIFVTPQIVENASQGTEDLKKNFRVKVK